MVRTVDDALGRLDDFGLAPQHEHERAAHVAHVQRLVVLVKNKSERATHAANLGGMVASAPYRGNLGKARFAPTCASGGTLEGSLGERPAEGRGEHPEGKRHRRWDQMNRLDGQGAEQRWQQPPR